jgi:hypothetical protein
MLRRQRRQLTTSSRGGRRGARVGREMKGRHRGDPVRSGMQRHMKAAGADQLADFSQVVKALSMLLDRPTSDKAESLARRRPSAKSSSAASVNSRFDQTPSMRARRFPASWRNRWSHAPAYTDYGAMALSLSQLQCPLDGLHSEPLAIQVRNARKQGRRGWQATKGDQRVRNSHHRPCGRDRH